LKTRLEKANKQNNPHGLLKARPEKAKQIHPKGVLKTMPEKANKQDDPHGLPFREHGLKRHTRRMSNTGL
jgi:hypothetical protein